MGIDTFNDVTLIGRITKDPELQYTQSQTAYLRFNIAIDNGKDKDGNDLPADFPSVTCWGRLAEICGKYLKKGRMVAVHGSIKTGKYEKDGRTVYTQDVRADKVKFLEWASEIKAPAADQSSDSDPQVPGGFQKMTDDDIPF